MTHAKTFDFNSKYDLDRTVKGQAVGGPGKRPKLTMWDMVTLYDTQKKKLEDQAAYLEHKKMQNDLKKYYETQMEFK